tara:strand:+ start:488 stop:943 length:456 start_codon:yes stop_codon:yes gene_type:complete
MSVKVSMKVVRSIIGGHINESINKPAIIDCLVKTFDSHALEMLVDICVSEEEYQPFNINDVVMFQHVWNINHLDHGLTDGIDSRYGIIIGSDNYGDEFNPYYYKMNMQMFDLNEDNELIITPIDKYSNEITRVIPEKAKDLLQMYTSIKQA